MRFAAIHDTQCQFMQLGCNSLAARLARLKILIQIAGDHTVVELADLIRAHTVKALELWVRGDDVDLPR